MTGTVGSTSILPGWVDRERAGGLTATFEVRLRGGSTRRWSFRNGRGEPVGLEVDVAHGVALALGVRLELVPVPRPVRVEALASGACDLAIGRVRTDLARQVLYSRPLAEEAWAFLVPDYHREVFASLEEARRQPRLRVAVIGAPEWMARLKALLPKAEVIEEATEWDYGSFEGLTTAEIRETVPGWSVWRHGAPEGELAGEVAARADRVINRVRTDGAARALVFAHGHGCAGALHGEGVLGLVILGRVRIRDQDRRLADRAQLGQGGRARARDHQRGTHVRSRHVVDERNDLGR